MTLDQRDIDWARIPGAGARVSKDEVTAEGSASADLAVDPETVIDNSVWEDRHQYPDSATLRAGDTVPVTSGKHIGREAERVLRSAATLRGRRT